MPDSTMPVGEGSAGTDGIRGLGLQKPVQAILIDFRYAEELDAELPMFAPSNCGRLDCNGRSKVCRPYENPDR